MLFGERAGLGESVESSDGFRAVIARGLFSGLLVDEVYTFDLDDDHDGSIVCIEEEGLCRCGAFRVHADHATNVFVGPLGPGSNIGVFHEEPQTASDKVLITCPSLLN